MYNYPIPIRAHAIPYTNYSFTSRHNTYHKFLESLMHVCRVLVFQVSTYFMFHSVFLGCRFRAQKLCLLYPSHVILGGSRNRKEQSSMRSENDFGSDIRFSNIPCEKIISCKIKIKAALFEIYSFDSFYNELNNTFKYAIHTIRVKETFNQYTNHCDCRQALH